MSVATEFRQGAETAIEDTAWRTVHRVVFPVDGDTDTLPLYVDFDAARRVVDTTDAGAKRAATAASQLVSQRSELRSDWTAAGCRFRRTAGSPLAPISTLSRPAIGGPTPTCSRSV
jgi:hypothetical protein